MASVVYCDNYECLSNMGNFCMCQRLKHDSQGKCLSNSKLDPHAGGSMAEYRYKD